MTGYDLNEIGFESFMPEPIAEAMRENLALVKIIENGVAYHKTVPLYKAKKTECEADSRKTK